MEISLDDWDELRKVTIAANMSYSLEGFIRAWTIHVSISDAPDIEPQILVYLRARGFDRENRERQFVHYEGLFIFTEDGLGEASDPDKDPRRLIDPIELANMICDMRVAIQSWVASIQG